MYCDLPYKILVKRGSRIREKILVLKGLEAHFLQLESYQQSPPGPVTPRSYQQSPS